MSALPPASLGAIAALVAVVGCAAAAQSSDGGARTASSFSWTNDDLIVEDTVVQRRLIEGRPPRYPDAERARREEAAFLVAFVLDTTGRVEARSISFIGKTTTAFAQAVCHYLRTARFTPVAYRSGVPVRALVVLETVFAIEGGEWYGKTLNGSPARRHLSQEGAASALAEMRGLPHCLP